jgi:hypothetical protein
MSAQQNKFLRTVYLDEFSARKNERHPQALRIVEEPGNYYNLGAICYDYHCLDLQNSSCRGGRYLIGEIEKRGGNFLAEPRRRPDKRGATCCWGGTAYEAGVKFDSMDEAIKYLKRFFTVRASLYNQKYDGQWIDGF